MNTTTLSFLAALLLAPFGANCEDKPMALPGLIQSTAYKKGGEGSGYHDTSKGYGPFPKGHGGQAWKRNDDVEVDWAFWDKAANGAQDKTHWAKGQGGSVCANDCGDMDVWFDATEWLAYDVAVEKDAEFIFILRVAYGGAAQPAPVFHLELDGKKIGGDITLPKGSKNNGEFSNLWHHFYDMPTQVVKIAAGLHLLKVVCDVTGKDGAPQLHYIEVKPKP
jgi:hypothetical protein